MPTKVTSKGQVTIPKRIRDALKLEQGTAIEFGLEGSRAFLEPVVAARVESLAGAREDEGRLMEQVHERVAVHARKEGLAPRHQRRPQVPSRR